MSTQKLVSECSWQHYLGQTKGGNIPIVHQWRKGAREEGGLYSKLTGVKGERKLPLGDGDFFFPAIFELNPDDHQLDRLPYLAFS